MKLKTVSINEKEQIFLDGEAIENVTAYKLENSANSNEPAKLTVTMYVTVDRICSELQIQAKEREKNDIADAY